MNYYPSATDISPFVPDDLCVKPGHTKAIVIKAGQNLARGAVVQEGTSGDVGKYLICTVDASAKYILAEPCNAVADTVAMAFVTGTFKPNKLVIGGGATLAGVEKTLEPLSIFFAKVVK